MQLDNDFSCSSFIKRNYIHTRGCSLCSADGLFDYRPSFHHPKQFIVAPCSSQDTFESRISAKDRVKACHSKANDFLTSGLIPFPTKYDLKKCVANQSFSTEPRSHTISLRVLLMSAEGETMKSTASPFLSATLGNRDLNRSRAE